MSEATETLTTTTNDGEQTGTTEGTEQSTSDQQSQTEGTQPEETTHTGAPEAYEFKAPEGSEFDPEVLKTFSETAKELDLSQEKAQLILDKMNPVMAAQQAARIESVRNEWAESSKVDKEFGGDKLNENMAVAKTALDKFGTPELKSLINETGLGNHPEVIRFFVRAGKALAPDTFIPSSIGNKPVPKSQSGYAEALYPTKE